MQSIGWACSREDLEAQRRHFRWGQVYSHTYCWSDYTLLRRFLATPRPPRTVVEAAPGPNVAVARALADVSPGALYLPVDPQEPHLRLLCGSVPGLRAFPIVATASALPLCDACADVVVFHHAMDDIYESEGDAGVAGALAEAARVTRPGGRLLFAHSVLPGDPATLAVSLAQIRPVLAARGKWALAEEQASQLEWLVAVKEGEL